MSGAVINASDFLPASKKISQPKDSERMICPLDGAELNNYLYWFESRGYKKPRMAYSAISLLTKENGEWKWIPDVVNLED